MFTVHNVESVQEYLISFFYSIFPDNAEATGYPMGIVLSVFSAAGG